MFELAPLFTRIASLVTTSANAAEAKNSFENFVKEVSSLRGGGRK